MAILVELSAAGTGDVGAAGGKVDRQALGRRTRGRMKPEERQLWRVLNASAITYLNLEILFNRAPQPLGLVALDGVPLNENGKSGDSVNWQTHLGVPPGARVEFIMKGPALGVTGLLVTRSVDTGPGGENDPNRAIARITASKDAPEPRSKFARPASTDVETSPGKRVCATKTATFCDIQKCGSGDRLRRCMVRMNKPATTETLKRLHRTFRPERTIPQRFVLIGYLFYGTSRVPGFMARAAWYFSSAFARSSAASSPAFVFPQSRNKLPRL